MPSRLINYNQLETSLNKVKAYITNNVNTINAAIDKKSDKTHTHESKDIIKLTNYKKGTATALATTDSLNTALGKLEALLDTKQNTGNYSVVGHNHDDRYYTESEINTKINTINTSITNGDKTSLNSAKEYTDSKITELVGTAPENLNTLQELAQAIKDHQDVYDAYVATVNKKFDTKSDKTHTHNEATTEASGFMSASDKTKLNGIANNANNYTHPTTSGNKHIPAGGSSGQILRWSSDGTATWGSDNNNKVTNTLNATAKAYVTGTTSSTTSTGGQIFDTSVYLGAEAGSLYADTFHGALSGNATTATTLANSRTINGTAFNGSGNITTNSWGTSRTLTIGSTGKSVNGSGNVSWSLSEIGALPIAGGTMTGAITMPNSTNGKIKLTKSNGTVVDGLYLTSSDNIRLGNTSTQLYLHSSDEIKVNIGSGTAQTLYHTGNKPSPTDIGALPTAGGTMTGSIKYSGGGYTGNAIEFTNGDANGAGISIGAGGLTIIGSGESAATVRTNSGISASTETMVVASDQQIEFMVGLQNGYDNVKTVTISNTGVLSAPQGITGNASSATKLQTARTISLSGAVTGSATFDGTKNISIEVSANGAGANDVTTITKSLTITTSWKDTGIAGTNLSTGSYIVQMLVNDGVVNIEEYYTGVMSWYDGTCINAEADEILLHKAGKASNSNHVYLRTKRVKDGSMKLQIASTAKTSAATSFVFKFKKLI